VLTLDHVIPSWRPLDAPKDFAADCRRGAGVWRSRPSSQSQPAICGGGPERGTDPAAPRRLPRHGRREARRLAFVTARFREDDDGTLQLVWIGPAGESLDERLLAEVAEPRSGPTQSTLSVNAAVCPAGSGLARTRYLFGQETNERTLELGGVPSVGGAVTDGTYVFAIAGESFDASTRWEISDESGDLVSDGDGTWFASPPSSSPDTCAITSDH
jgi:hypothetical protein